MTAVYLINRMPIPTLQNKSPYEVCYNKRPTYKHLRAFGCLCYVYSEKINRTKLDPRARECIFIGYPPHVKGYKCFDIEKQTIIVSRHVKFIEAKFSMSKNLQNQPKPVNRHLEIRLETPRSFMDEEIPKRTTRPHVDISPFGVIQDQVQNSPMMPAHTGPSKMQFWIIMTLYRPHMSQNNQ